MLKVLVLSIERRNTIEFEPKGVPSDYPHPLANFRKLAKATLQIPFKTIRKPYNSPFGRAKANGLSQPGDPRTLFFRLKLINQ